MGKRNCIKCGDTLIPKMVEDVEVDYCGACGGMWLDHGEIRELAAKTDEVLFELRRLVGQDGEQDTPSTVDSPCPACGGKMTVAILDDVNIERCGQCHGIFLDTGELDKAMVVVKARGSSIATILALARSVVTHGVIKS